VILCRWKEGWDGELVEGSEGSRLEQLDTFHTYVRPTWKPILTEFCTSLTGITQVSLDTVLCTFDADVGQETVDKSPTFSEMLVDLEKWMNKWDLLDERGALKDAVWVSDGVSDCLAEK
jgi:inhibitor of KinA sporulation pathway (predicted exonuclease)